MKEKKKVVSIIVTSMLGLFSNAADIVSIVKMGNPPTYKISTPLIPSPGFVTPDFVQMFDGKYKMALDTNGNIWEGDADDLWEQTSVTGVSKISVSSEHAVAIKSGKLWVKGSNYDGQLGIGGTSDVSDWVELPSINGVTDILASGGDDGCQSYYNTYYISANTVYSSGSNIANQLGRAIIPGACESDYDYCDVFGATSLTNAVSIKGGVINIFALTTSNELYSTMHVSDSWGKELENVTDYSVSSNDVFAVANGGKVYTFGHNTHDYLTTGMPFDGNFEETSLTNPSDIVSFGVDEEYSGASAYALVSGELYLLGYNNDGEMGFQSQSEYSDWVHSGVTDVVKMFDDGGKKIYIKKSDGKYYYPENGEFKTISIVGDEDEG